ncbi:MAG: hypothetical protein NZM10_00905 [Fimbriimonadales bacterium]|nr:hypothetical protein [Fimbriimonadales bacterium]
MMRRLKAVREQWWLVGVVGGVLMLFAASWLARELRPLSSDALFEEARVDIGASGYISGYQRGLGYYLAALARAGETERANAFISSLPNDIEPFVLHEWLIALLDTGQLDEAMRAAAQLGQMPPYRPQNTVVHQSDALMERLLSELLRAGRYEDALKALPWLEATSQGTTPRDWSDYLGQRAAEDGRLDITVQAALGIRAYSTFSELYLLRVWLNQNRVSEALEWLRRMPDDYNLSRALWTPLPTAYQAGVNRARALVQQGRAAQAAQLAETILRRYLEMHTQQTADFNLLARLSLQFGMLLPPETMNRLLQRLPTQRYQCAETHLTRGYLYSLGSAGRWREALQQPLLADALHSGHELRWLLTALALEQNRPDAAQKLGRRITDPLCELEAVFTAARFLLETGRPDAARALVNFVEIPNIRARIQQAIRRSRASALSPELADALAQLAQVNAYALYRFTKIALWQDALDTLALHALFLGDRNAYPALMRVIESQPSLQAESHLRYQISLNAWLQDFYDPFLAQWLLRTSGQDLGDQQNLARAAAAAAQAGQFSDAQRLMQRAGRVSRCLHDVDLSGYAVGLARQGRHREAVRTARRIGVTEYRVYALANIAAEMKRRGL